MVLAEIEENCVRTQREVITKATNTVIQIQQYHQTAEIATKNIKTTTITRRNCAVVTASNS